MTCCLKATLAVLILVSLEFATASSQDDGSNQRILPVTSNDNGEDEMIACIETIVGYLCIECNPGYILEGKYCRRRSKCESNPCFPGVECKNISTSPYYECGKCPEGYLGNGIECKDIDECKLGRPCDPRVICHNLSPGFSCDPCPSGFTGSKGYFGVGLKAARNQNQECKDIDECADGENGGCVENSYCINTEGSFFCGRCKKGFVGDQTLGCKIIPGGCTDGSECDPNAICIYQMGLKGNICKCNIGWAGNGHICGKDSDLDGFPDINLNCTEPQCKKDNCEEFPNAGQDDADDDDVGDACDEDADNDGIPNKIDNCPLASNPDQIDTDHDQVGDECDNCPCVSNSGQQDEDGDGIGDACDPDIDNDGISNNRDNCPNIPNENQLDTDSDGCGNVCDNCPDIPNVNQEDEDMDGLGDACDDGHDKDKDGCKDTIDNCPEVPNSDQLDTDEDGEGDGCDADIDGDWIPNEKDNCPLVFNPMQKDLDKNGVGDLCQEDNDFDKVPDYLDICPNNSEIFKTDFSKYHTVALDPIGEDQNDPKWYISKDGEEILQTVNSSPGIAVGPDKLGGVDYEGTLFIARDDDDIVGFIFSYQSNRKFYVVSWKGFEQKYWVTDPFRASANTGVTLKLVDSATGPGEWLRNALWHKKSVKDEVKILWEDPSHKGWEQHVSYRWKLLHRPKIGLIRLKIFNNTELVTDSGNIFDSTLKGGHLGVYCFSQGMVYWANLVYKCNDDVPEEVYKELSPNLQDRVKIDRSNMFISSRQA